MATLKHEKAKEDAHRKMLEDGILKILARLDSIEKRLTRPEVKQKPKGGRNA